MKQTFWQKHRFKIIVIALFIPFLFLDTCSFYRYGPEFQSSKGKNSYLFKKKNINAITNMLAYLLEQFIPDDKTEDDIFRRPLEKLDKVEQALVRAQLKRNRNKQISFAASFSPLNLFSSSQADKDKEKAEKLLARKKEQRKKQAELANRLKQGEKRKVLNALEKEIEKLKEKNTAEDPELEKTLSEIADASRKKEGTKKEEDEMLLKQGTFHTFELTFSRIGRLKAGLCGKNPCFNTRGKDYSLHKSPVSNLHYFISDRIDVSSQKTGRFKIYAVEAKPSSKRYEPSFTNLTAIKIPGINSNVFGFALYKKQGKLFMIFSHHNRLYETSTSDGRTFVKPRQILAGLGRVRDPSLSADGLVLAVDTVKNKLRSWVTVIRRPNVNEDFKKHNREQLIDSEQETGPGIFPCVIRHQGRNFIIFRSFTKLLSAEIANKTILPAVLVKGELPDKYITQYDNIVIGSFLPDRSNYDLAWFKVSSKKTVVKRVTKVVP